MRSGTPKIVELNFCLYFKKKRKIENQLPKISLTSSIYHRDQINKNYVMYIYICNLINLRKLNQELSKWHASVKLPDKL